MKKSNCLITVDIEEWFQVENFKGSIQYIEVFLGFNSCYSIYHIHYYSSINILILLLLLLLLVLLVLMK